MGTIRLTAAQAMVRFLIVQRNEEGAPLIPGVWAIFGHGNVAGLGEALAEAGDALPTWRGHNEQSMAHAAIAYAKATNRRQAMAVTTSIGPGATNMVTACAVAHVNRLPLLLVPGDVFATRQPDPVLQQIEDFDDGTVSVNDCFRPVARYFDRIGRAEHLLSALPRAMRVLTDPADCGPVVLAFPQDVQTEAYDWPESFFAERIWQRRRPHPDPREIDRAAEMIRAAKTPMIVAGGGVLYSGAMDALKRFADAHNIVVTETHAGRSALPWSDPLNFGAPGVCGSAAANAVAEKADLVIGVGTRFQDFTTGSWAVFKNPERRLLAINVCSYDGIKHGAVPLIADAKVALEALDAALGQHKATLPDPAIREDWFKEVDRATAAPHGNALPTDAQVIGAAQRGLDENAVLLCASGGLPGELQKLWKASKPNGYHMEYGYSCMGYEIAGAIGAKMAMPDREICVMVGDGSYMMMNSELATSVMIGQKIIVILLDNRGFGCINRLQMACGGKSFNNLLDTARHVVPSNIDFAAHAAAMGAIAEKVDSISELEEALGRARASDRSHVIVIDTDPLPSTEAGGAWWEVAVPEVSNRAEVRKARDDYEAHLAARKAIN
ncbi:3D-(3,5/4)-trihydroxycyclohexane-1,2-dione acylhydrolase (decyclizing) [Consotaella salsifontis]|uniref:3D-(3,5/4)-trihydroxycyclohexane-1,2-dione hydrolase n=1 Tax=Consotaella salsifontis TaxID=1365950 RepID=A0A1T4RLU9_9HYPH|nr:3D-(3,5/4)-trihydroxycyclohexane-1,2-dione acylhydrolase (decyclizing) [Consotaella salsifontis]SKA16970.1 3D-(3,5/4)-trihydroxycyclohexane-1,2-dione hydrolase [Consotaella salsifontis]